MVEKLVTRYGEYRDKLNEKLSKLGYSLGNSSRLEKYQTHEVRQYTIDDNFPRIVPEMFKGETLPAGKKQISYDVDLSVVPSTSIRVIETPASE